METPFWRAPKVSAFDSRNDVPFKGTDMVVVLILGAFDGVRLGDIRRSFLGD
jgi:hypothetical protein